MISISGYLYYVSRIKDDKIIELNSKLEELEEKEQLVVSYKDDLATIKELKQEIMGQEHKLEELNKQIREFTDLVIQNEEKVSKLEDSE